MAKDKKETGAVDYEVVIPWFNVKKGQVVHFDGDKVPDSLLPNVGRIGGEPTAEGDEKPADLGAANAAAEEVVSLARDEAVKVVNAARDEAKTIVADAEDKAADIAKDADAKAKKVVEDAEADAVAIKDAATKEADKIKKAAGK